MKEIVRGESRNAFFEKFHLIIARIRLLPEESEDMWHVYNLIQTGDCIKSSTVRKVQSESATGSVTTQKVKTTLTIQVEQTQFDPQEGQLRLTGRNVEENAFVKV